MQALEESFYVDNVFRSLPTAAEAKSFVDKLRDLLSAGGFEIRQWASNDQRAVSHPPTDARSESMELWLLEKPK